MDSGRILITGATGFVGTALLAALRRRGVPLTLAVRNHAAVDEPGIRSVQVGEVGSKTDWTEALRDVASVVHLAAHVHVSPERALRETDLFDEINHIGSRRLFEAAAARGAGLFVHLSSITVLGAATASGRPFTDVSPVAPSTPYSRSKLAAERALAEAADGSATRLVVLRPPLIAGPGVKGNLRRLLQLAALPIPLPLGGMRNRRTLLSLDNLVSALTAILARGREAPAGSYVLGDRDPVSTTDIVVALRKGLGRRRLLWPAPSGLASACLRTLGRAGLAQRLFGNLELESSRFRHDFAWSDVVETRACLRETAHRYAPNP